MKKKQTLLYFVIALVVLAFSDRYVKEKKLSASIEKELFFYKNKLEEKESEYKKTINEKNAIIEKKKNEVNQLRVKINSIEDILNLPKTPQDTEHNVMMESLNNINKIASIKSNLLKLVPNGTPVDYKRISSKFGTRTNPISKKRHFHSGIDLTCQTGQDIKAPADGVVETVRSSKKGYGNFLTIRHAFGFMTSYAHLSRFNVRNGQFVSKGQVIANCGNSGNSTGPHLHYEVRFVGRALNPKTLMDWSMSNYSFLFNKEKKVDWQSLNQLASALAN
ncbi:M23 family metallopeptidase [Vibrio harveyi]|nr:M23 family metallopeptidase [Vibrio harveyi]